MGPVESRSDDFGGKKAKFRGSDSDGGEGNGYSNREEGSSGVPTIVEGECNLMFANEKVMPFGPSGIAVTSSTI